jgi:hypothetical protein
MVMKDQMKNTQPPASRGSHPKTPNNAEIVFARVLQILQTNSSASSKVPGQDWLKKKHTIADVQEEIKKAQEKYHLRAKDSRTRKWLSRFSSGVLYYGQIMDVLVQHHPEYVSLAWGTTKLLFVVSSRNLSLGGQTDRDGFERLWQQRVLLSLSIERDQENSLSSRLSNWMKSGDAGSSVSHLTCPLGEIEKDFPSSRRSPGTNRPKKRRATQAAAYCP